jgi:hypothetical protein
MTIAEAVQLLKLPNMEYRDPLRLMHSVCVFAGSWLLAVNATGDNARYRDAAELIVNAETAELYRACEEYCAEKPETERGE